MKLRPHHIFCVSFLKADFSERGAGFLHVEQRVRDAVWSDEETLIETAEGVDELCRACPLVGMTAVSTRRGTKRP